ncbi:DNA primase [Pectobacterium phage PP2]|uniref:DNA primase n=1 Tax=Pectobacterium phage PP2 TaxID=1897743 RepID=A0A1W5P501_9CAUD|nr:DNA primase [Pectobacterium phage PP2]AOT25379.1 DNA primase [Pectobacterium phage PP2]
MAKRIEDRLWLPQARSLPLGGSTKVIHNGCGKRPSMFVKNDPDKYWCYCHRCHGGGHYPKEQQRVKMKLTPKTGWVPQEQVPLLSAIVKEPHNFTELFSRYPISRYVSILTFSPDTRRIYFPDESGSKMGLDVTGQANARMYSPYKHNMAVYTGGVEDQLVISGNLSEYLSLVYRNMACILVYSRNAEKPALAALSLVYENYSRIVTGLGLTDNFKRDIRPFTG